MCVCANLSLIHSLMAIIPEDKRALLLPSFVNLLHLDDPADPPDEADINFDMRYVRLVYFMSYHSDTLFNGTYSLNLKMQPISCLLIYFGLDTPRSHDTSLENTPVKDTRVRRAHTVNAVGAAGQSLRKKFNQVAGSIRGDNSKVGGQDSGHMGGRMTSMLRNLSKKDRRGLLTSKSVDEAMGTETIRPLRPASSDRPLLVTAFQSPSKESISPPLEPIIASPIEDATGLMGPPPPRKKRRSSLSDLLLVQEAEAKAISNQILNGSPAGYNKALPSRPGAPPPPETPRLAVLNRVGSKSAARVPTPDPSASPSPAQASRRDLGNQDRTGSKKENISRKPVPKTPGKPSSNSTLRPLGLQNPAKVGFLSSLICPLFLVLIMCITLS